MSTCPPLSLGSPDWTSPAGESPFAIPSGFSGQSGKCGDPNATARLRSLVGPLRVESNRLFAGPLTVPEVAPTASNVVLPPPPTHPTAKLIYDLTIQLENPEIVLDLKMPLKGLNPGGEELMVDGHAVLGEKGALIVLGVDFNPPAVELLGKADLGVRVLRLYRDPESPHKIKGKVELLGIPLSAGFVDGLMRKKDFIHTEILNILQTTGSIPTELLKGPGYDLTQGLPIYSWQTMDALCKAIDARDQRSQQAGNKKPTTAKDPLVPDLDRTNIHIFGTFKNSEISLMGYKVKFAPTEIGKPHFVTVVGKLLQPSIFISDFKSIEAQQQFGDFKLENQDEHPQQIELDGDFDPQGNVPIRLRMANYASSSIHMDAHFKDTDQFINLDLKKGMNLENLSFGLERSGALQFAMGRATGKQVELNGMGFNMKTDDNSQAVVENMAFHLDKGQPIFSADVRGVLSGTVDYLLDQEDHGHIGFKILQGSQAHVSVGPDVLGKTRVFLDGYLKARFDTLNVYKYFASLHGFNQTDVVDMSMEGDMTMTVYPYDGRVLLQKKSTDSTGIHTQMGPQDLGGANSSSIDSKKEPKRAPSTSLFGQAASKVPDWLEDLVKKVGKKRAGLINSLLVTFVERLEFNIDKAELVSTSIPHANKPGLEFVELKAHNLHLRAIAKPEDKGLTKQWVFLRAPTGDMIPLELDEAVAEVNVGMLWDHPKEQNALPVSLPIGSLTLGGLSLKPGKDFSPIQNYLNLMAGTIPSELPLNLPNTTLVTPQQNLGAHLQYKLADDASISPVVYNGDHLIEIDDVELALDEKNNTFGNEDRCNLKHDHFYVKIKKIIYDSSKREIVALEGLDSKSGAVTEFPLFKKPGRGRRAGCVGIGSP